MMASLGRLRVDDGTSTEGEISGGEMNPWNKILRKRFPLYETHPSTTNSINVCNLH